MRTSRAHGEQAETRQPARGPAAARRETPSGGAAVPPPLTADALRSAQRGAGNAAVTGMIARRARTTPAPEQPDTGVREVLRSGGKPLAAPVRQEMEARFGTDFSGVRLHTGAAAARSARAIGARAYTSGSHVVLGDGGGDKHTLAHELTHVVQQRHGPVSGTDTGHGFAVSDPGDRFERAAEANAHKVMSGPVPDVQRLPEDGPETAAGADTVQRASTTVLENATVTHYKPSKDAAPDVRGLSIKRPKEVTGPITPTGTKGRPAAPNPIAVKTLHAAYKKEVRARGVAPGEAEVWKDLFGGAGYDRGHVMGLEVGGSDVANNIVPQWSLNQGTGMWRKIEQALVGVSSGNLRFEVIYQTDDGNHRKVMIPIRIDIYLDNVSYKSWNNEPDANDLIRAGRDPSDAAEYYTKAKAALNQTQLTEDQMQDFALKALAHDKATFLAYEDYETKVAQGEEPKPGTTTAGTHMKDMTRSTFGKDRRDKLIESYIAAGWVTRNGTGKNATYTLHDVPAPVADSDSESSSDSDVEMSDASEVSSPGQPFASIQYGSQSSSSDEDWDAMSTGS